MRRQIKFISNLLAQGKHSAKWILGLMLLGSACIAGAAPITLAWDYDASLLSTNNTFTVYHSTNAAAPLNTWAAISTVPGTQTQATVDVQPGEHHFVVTVRNFWGESGFSNIASTPAATPRGEVLHLRIVIDIQKGN